MKVITTVRDLRLTLDGARRDGKTVGFVPTLGCLHEGHLVLARTARQQNDVVVVSIFVNPIQFGEEEFKTYPRDLDRDCVLLRSASVDYVFAPTLAEMYPQPLQAFAEVPKLGRAFQDCVDWDDFRGVATVVAKFFNMVQPTKAYFGEKDYQQLQVIRRLAYDLSFPVEVVSVPTVRDSDGVALSSRNAKLSSAERDAARSLHRALNEAGKLVKSGRIEASRELERAVTSVISAEPLATIEIVAVRDATTLEFSEDLPQKILVLLFVRFGKTQLLDQAVFDRTPTELHLEVAPQRRKNAEALIAQP